MTRYQPTSLYTREQVYALDKLAIEVDAQPGLQLMYRAALSVWRNIQRRWPETCHMVVLAGPGNNGGDAYAVACLARDDGVPVDVVTMGDMSRQSAESAHFRHWWLESGGNESGWDGQLAETDIIVDGLLGIGLNKALDDDWAALIRAINAGAARRVCIDIPSGLNANCGSAQPLAVRADLTVSFIGRKQGCLVGDGPDFCGELVFDDLGMSRDCARRVEPSMQVLDGRSIRLPVPRLANSFKNRFGHVLVVGGAAAYAGAAQLAASAALRCGAGLVSLCVEDRAANRMDASELMVGEWSDFDQLVGRASVILVGPGLGDSDDARLLLERVCRLELPMVIDADALRADFIDKLASSRCVLTPHPGEAARLLDAGAADIQSDRPGSAQRLLERWPLTWVLKGSGTLVAASDAAVSLCQRGHPGMASAGMGDVLAGLIAGLLAQGLEPADAARSGVYLHALAADIHAEQQPAESLIASDVIARWGDAWQRVQRQREVF